MTPWTVARQAPLSMGLFRQECWSGLPFSPPGDLPEPGIKPVSLALAGGFFTSDSNRDLLITNFNSFFHSLSVKKGWKQNWLWTLCIFMWIMMVLPNIFFFKGVIYSLDQFFLRVLFYLLGILRTSSLGDSISRDPERTPPRRQREEPGYIEVLQQRNLISSAKVVFDPYILIKS